MGELRTDILPRAQYPNQITPSHYKNPPFWENFEEMGSQNPADTRFHRLPGSGMRPLTFMSVYYYEVEDEPMQHFMKKLWLLHLPGTGDPFCSLVIDLRGG